MQSQSKKVSLICAKNCQQIQITKKGAKKELSNIGDTRSEKRFKMKEYEQINNRGSPLRSRSRSKQEASVSRSPRSQKSRDNSSQHRHRNSSSTGPDPSRYAKYLSLRNRKTVENRVIRDLSQRQQQEEAATIQTQQAYNRDQQNNVEERRQKSAANSGFQPSPIRQQKSCLKSTSSRVSCLRNKNGGSTESLLASGSPLNNRGRISQNQPLLAANGVEPYQSAFANERHRALIQTSGEEIDRRMSPLRILQNKTNREGSRGSAGAIGGEEIIARETFWQQTQGKSSTNESPSKRNADLRDTLQRGQQQFQEERKQQKQNQMLYYDTNQMSGSPNDDDNYAQELNFDFDKDGQESYLNTTQQSLVASDQGGEINENTNKKSRHSRRRSSGHSLKKASEHLENLGQTVQNRRVANNIEQRGSLVEEDSSGYVIEYEQMLHQQRESGQEQASRGESPPKIENAMSPDPYFQERLVSRRDTGEGGKHSTISERSEPRETTSVDIQINDDGPIQEMAQEEDYRSLEPLENHRSPNFELQPAKNNQSRRSRSRSSKKASINLDRYPSPQKIGSIGENTTEYGLAGLQNFAEQISIETQSVENAGRKNMTECHRDEQHDFMPKNGSSEGSKMDDRDHENSHKNNKYFHHYDEPILTFENSHRRREGVGRSASKHEEIELYKQDDQYEENVKWADFIPTKENNDRSQHEFRSGKKSGNFSSHEKTEATPILKNKNAGNFSEEENEHADDIEAVGGLSAEYLRSSGKKLQDTNETIDQAFEKTKQGSMFQTNLMVTCIIRQPMNTFQATRAASTGGLVRDQANKRQISQASSLVYGMSNSNSTGALGQRASGPKTMQSAANQTNLPFQMGSTRFKSSLLDKSTGSVANGRKSPLISSSGGGNGHRRRNKRSTSQDSASHHSRSLSASQTRRRKGSSVSHQRAGQKSSKKRHVSKQDRHAHLLTTQEPSQYLLRSPPGLQSQLLSILLKTKLDLHHCNMAFGSTTISINDEATMTAKQSLKKMKIFEFDNVIGETRGHSLSLGLEQNVRWVTKQIPNEKVTNLVILFGQADSLKQQLLNVVNPNSLLNQSIKSNFVRFIRVSMFHYGQEYLLANKTFGSKAQMKREFGMELREAYRERDLNSKKIALKLSSFQQQVRVDEVKMASHLVIQIDNLVYLDLADIDNLKNPLISKGISADYSAVTNAILALSPHYCDEKFATKSSSQERLLQSPYADKENFRSGSSSFKSFASSLLSKKSKVLLLCCVTQSSLPGTQAVDYCNKIRNYFSGLTETSQAQIKIDDSMFEGQSQEQCEELEHNTVNAYKQLQGLISEVSKSKAFVDQVFEEKRRGDPARRSFTQMKNIVECLKEDVGDLLSSLAANNPVFVHQLSQLRGLLQQEIHKMKDKVQALKTLNRRDQSTMSHKSWNANIALLPKQQIQEPSAKFQQTRSVYNVGQEQIIPKNNNFKAQNNSQTRNKRPSSQNSARSRTGLQNGQAILRQSQGVRNTNIQSSQNSHRGNEGLLTPQSGRITPGTGTVTQSSKQKQVISHSRQQQHQKQPVILSQTTNSALKQSSMTQSAQIVQKRPMITSSMNRTQQQTTNSNWSRQNKTPQTRNDNLASKSSSQGGGRVTPTNRTASGSVQKSLKETTSNMQGASMLKNKPATMPNKQPMPPHPRAIDQLKQSRNSQAKKSKESSNEGTQYLKEAYERQLTDMRVQLRDAIAFGEEQSIKRQQAEQMVIVLTSEKLMISKQVDSLEERIVAKDQTVASLENQLNFVKEHARNQEQMNLKDSARSAADSAEIETLRKQKAEADRVNRQILGQIGMLKDAISTFQKQERFNQKLLMAQRKKDKEVKELRKQVQQMKEEQERQNKFIDIDQMLMIQSKENNGLSLNDQLQRLNESRERHKREAENLKLQLDGSNQMAGNNLRPLRGGSQESRSGRNVEKQRVVDRLHQDLYAAQITQPMQNLNELKNLIKDFKQEKRTMLKTASSREFLSKQSSQMGSSHRDSDANFMQVPQTEIVDQMEEQLLDQNHH